MTAFLNLLLVF